MVIKIILLVILAFIFLPIKIEVLLEDGKDIAIKIFNIKLLRKNKVKSKEDIEDKIADIFVNMLDNKNKIPLLKVIYKAIDFKKIKIYIGTNNPVITTAIFSFLNTYIAANIEKFSKAKINMEMFYTEKLYKYKIDCIFKISIAETIVILLKERWNKVWQNIQLKV